jgi:hypothetical protein
MRLNDSDAIRPNVNTPSNTVASQEIHAIGAPNFLTTNEEELCEYLVTKYQNQFPLTDDRKQEFQQDYRFGTRH